MAKSKTRNSYNYNYLETHKEVNNSPSLTVPDQGLNAKELLARLRQNQEVPYFHGYYDEEMTLPEIEKMDNLDRLQFAAELRERMKNEIPRTKGERFADYVDRVKKQKQAEKRAAEQAANEPETGSNTDETSEPV